MKNKKDFFVSHDNFLDPYLIKQIDEHVEASRTNTIWRTSQWWEPAVRRVTSPIAILTLPEEFHLAILQRLKKVKEISWKDDKPPLRSQYYLYPPGGYIAWHDDTKYAWASTIYLNPVWDPNWGGIHLHEDLKGLGIRGEIPWFNRAIINSGGVPHAVSVLTPDAPFRRVISTFGPYAPLPPHPDSERAHKKWREWKRKRNIGAVYFEGSLRT